MSTMRKRKVDNYYGINNTMNDTEKILKEIYLPLNRIISDLVTLGDMSIVQYIRKMADEIESSGHTSKSPLYVSLNRKINTLIDQAVAAERDRERELLATL